MHVSICNSPSAHEKTCLPYSVAEEGDEDHLKQMNLLGLSVSHLKTLATQNMTMVMKTAMVTMMIGK